ncbi:MAG: CoA transferase [Chloroflexi bacterium]|nr:CoA transferase [Chloroflexota bacterium]
MADGVEGALSGIRVIEYGEYISAPFCGKLLADLGADVLKIEPPGKGDLARAHGPFPGNRPDPERSGLFLYLNANKRGITLDLRQPGDREQLRMLVETADVLVANCSPRRAEELGLTYHELSSWNPLLVGASISPFGQHGPYRDFEATDLTISAIGGISDQIGEPGREPLRLPFDQAEYQAGLHAAGAILAALFAREQYGVGQHVEIAMADVLTFQQSGRIHNFVHHGRVRRRSGHRTPGFYPYTILPCRDGYVSMIAGRGGQWKRFLELISGGKVPEWYSSDPRFRSRLEISWKYADEMDERLSTWLGEHPKEEIFHLCQARGIPFTPVYSLAEVAESEHLQARDFFVEYDHPVAGRVRTPGAPYRLSETPWRLRRPAPTLAQDNREVLGSGPKWLQLDRVSLYKAPQTSDARLPLTGYRVVDFGWVMAGPLLGRLLADLGAEVIKVESPTHLDEMRQSPSNPTGDVEQDPVFHDVNRNKLGVAVDFGSQAGASALRRLIARSDVVVENFSPGVLARHGLDYASLRRECPGIVMVSLSAAGQTGPLRDIRTYGPSLTGLAGFDGLVGYEGERVLGSQAPYSDETAAAHGAFAVLAALWHRERTGIGQHIDLAQWETLATCIGEGFAGYFMNGTTPGPLGNSHARMAPHNNYPCAGDDEWIAIAVRTDEEWGALVDVMGTPAWAGRSELATAAGRVQRRRQLDELIAAWTRGHAAADLFVRLQAAGIAAAPSLHVGQRYFDPHFQARGLYVDVEHPRSGVDILHGVIWRLSQTPGRIDRPAPLLGQHNDYVLREIAGLSCSELAELRGEAVALGASAEQDR